MIELLGLKECENVIAGNDLARGISGGQKRRLTLVCERTTSCLALLDRRLTLLCMRVLVQSLKSTG